MSHIGESTFEHRAYRLKTTDSVDTVDTVDSVDTVENEEGGARASATFIADRVAQYSPAMKIW